MNEPKTKQLQPCVLLAICVALMALCLWSAKAVLITALLIPMIGAYLSARTTVSWSIAYYMSAGILCYLFLPEFWLYAFCMILLASLPTALTIRKKVRSYEALILSCIGWLLALCSFIAYTYLVHGVDPLTFIMENIRRLIEEDELFLRDSYLTIKVNILMGSDSLGLPVEKVLEMLNAWANSPAAELREYVLSENAFGVLNNYYATVVPTLGVDLSLIGGLVSYLAVRAFVKRTGGDTAPVPAFKDFKLPVKVTTPFALLYVLCLVVELFLELSPALMLAASLLMNALTIVFTIQGATLICWFVSLRAKSRGSLVGLTIVFILVALLLGALSWIGLIELFLKVRYRVIVRKDPE